MGLDDRIARVEQARWGLPAIVAVALAVRLALALALPQQPISDGLWYMDHAAEMARGLGYQEAGYVTAFWPVGYPAVLAAAMSLLGPTLSAAILLNLIATAAIVLLIVRIGAQLGLDGLATRIAAALYALYPAHIVYAGQPVSETVATAVAMAAFALLIGARGRRWGSLAAGLLFGIATLMRPQMMFFPAGMLVAMALTLRDFGWRGALRAALPLYLALAAVVTPWSLRNAAELGAAVPVSTNGGIALYYGANDRATGDWYAWERTPVWDATGVGIPYKQHIVEQVELDRRFKALAVDWIKRNPGRWTALGFRKMALLWERDSDAFWALDIGYPALATPIAAVRVFNQLCYFAILALGLSALGVALPALWRRERLAPLLMLACMPAFATLTAFAFTGQGRYHYPAMPFLFVAAGWTLAALLRWWAARSPAPLLRATAA
ncbi:glycosyltransferase family 39 protein [Sphingomonas immobilis]|uniref:Glycosyltransferase family 39 protein n=1 Tax=Sphingomonas immobilis TaxID=3063997 RepID=A0ABT8ZZ58_9SPHN|nr:glycosyltransferase family 39 protein [Sphingomonas sp. CA1-15]MDO7842477.1 glycosyltransferase family 39 protein [Sphingomonas sp. CA1-15]